MVVTKVAVKPPRKTGRPVKARTSRPSKGKTVRMVRFGTRKPSRRTRR